MQGSWTTVRAERELQLSSGKASPFFGRLKGSSVTRYGLEEKGDDVETSRKEREAKRREMETEEKR